MPVNREKEKQKEVEMSLLIHALHSIIDEQFLKAVERNIPEHNQEALHRYKEWVSRFSELYLSTRTTRAEELESAEMQQAQEIARTFFGKYCHDFDVICMDGRNIPAVMMSKLARVGGTLRSAAARLGFRKDQDNTIYFDRQSFILEKLIQLFRSKQGNTIFYWLDSHLGCAARKGIEQVRDGDKFGDGGLLVDVREKMTEAQGITELEQTLKKQGDSVAHVIPTLFSYDPHAGSMIFGLEMHAYSSAVQTEGFSENILNTLSKNGNIVRTADLLHDLFVLGLLEQHIKAKSADFRNMYTQALLKNWEIIQALYEGGNGALFMYLHNKMESAYATSGWMIGDIDNLSEQKISNIALIQKTKRLLQNLVTRYSIAGNEHDWPFENHQETMVVVTEGGYAPFPSLDAFSVFPHSDSTLDDMKLSIDLLRQFRADGRSKNPIASILSNQKEFVSAPVVITNKIILRGISDDDWNVLAGIDLQNLSRLRWDDVSTRQLDRAGLMDITIRNGQEKLSPHSVSVFSQGMFDMFQRIRKMWSDDALNSMLRNGNVMLLNLIVDEDRKPKILIPFIF